MSYSTAAFGTSINAYFLAQVAATSTDPAAQAQAVKVAQIIADFIAKAQKSIHIAIYDFRLNGEAETLVINALDNRANAGLTVQIAYDHSKSGKTGEFFAALGSDPAPTGTHIKMTALHQKNPKIQVKPIVGPKLVASIALEPIETGGHLMHSKFILRDAGTPHAAILMGSANFTDDAWSLQENNILTYANAVTLTGFYEKDFEELWKSEKIAGTGKSDTGDATIGGIPIHVMFSPGAGSLIEQQIAQRIEGAKHRVAIASMVISSDHVLSALDAVMDKVPTFKGIFDSGEMDMVVKQWGKSTAAAKAGKLSSSDKAALFEKIAKKLHAKKSLPYQDTSPHNFMHNKLVVVDDLVITGSFNFSISATHNAENVVFTQGKEIADQYEKYVDALIKQYPHTGL